MRPNTEEIPTFDKEIETKLGVAIERIDLKKTSIAFEVYKIVVEANVTK